MRSLKLERRSKRNFGSTMTRLLSLKKSRRFQKVLRFQKKRKRSKE